MQMHLPGSEKQSQTLMPLQDDSPKKDALKGNSLQEDILKILRPRYPEAAFGLQYASRAVCRLRSRLYRDPDRLGPDHDGISVEYALRPIPWKEAQPLPHTWKKDWREFQEEFGCLPAGNGNGYLEFWIRTPTLNPPKKLQAALVKVFQSYASEWNPKVLHPGSLDFDMLRGSWSYPGMRSSNDLERLDASTKPTYITLDEIADCGKVYIRPDGNVCVLIWYSPDEGIGYGSAVVYKREPAGWRVDYEKNLRLPAVEQNGQKLQITGQVGNRRKVALTLPWPGPIWTEDGDLMEGLLRLLRSHDRHVVLHLSDQGDVTIRLRTRMLHTHSLGERFQGWWIRFLKHEGADPDEGKRMVPDKGGLSVTYCRYLVDPRKPTKSAADRYQYESEGVRELHLTLPSGDKAGYIKAIIHTPILDPPKELIEAVILKLQEFASTWRPGLRDNRFGKHPYP